jgi:hypothetical protein
MFVGSRSFRLAARSSPSRAGAAARHAPLDVGGSRADHRRALLRDEDGWAKRSSTRSGAVESHLMADVPLGVFLSGGLDSGTIVALMHELGVNPIRTFTIGFGEKSFSEVDQARTVAERYGTEHHELVVRPDAGTLLPSLVRHFDEPFADSSAIGLVRVGAARRRRSSSGEGGTRCSRARRTAHGRSFRYRAPPRSAPGRPGDRAAPPSPAK